MNPRYSIIPAGAVTDPRIEPRDLQALCLLGRHIDDLGWCRRSQVKMARELGCARSTLQGSLDRLREAGWIEWRIVPSEGKGDTAFAYRVRLDLDDSDGPTTRRKSSGTGESSSGTTAAEGEGADLSAGGEGADLSAPVPAQERHPVPIYGSAPLTSPVNDSERERRARDPEQMPDMDALDALRRRYPQAAHADQVKVEAAWAALSATERKGASDRLDDWLADRGARKAVVGLEKYLGQKLWTLLPPAAKGQEIRRETGLVGPFTRAFWWLACNHAERNRATIRDPRSPAQAYLRNKFAGAAQGIGWKVDPASVGQIETAASGFASVHRDGPEAEAFRKRFATAFGFHPTMPDQAQWIFVPPEAWWGTDPPDSTGDADELARAMGG